MAEAGRYRLSPLAQADLEDIWSYTALRWSPMQAESYHATIIGAFEGLAAGRKQGRSADIRAGYLKYRVGSHVVFYRLSEAGIDIMRVLHERMDVSRHF